MDTWQYCHLLFSQYILCKNDAIKYVCIYVLGYLLLTHVVLHRCFIVFFHIYVVLNQIIPTF